MRQILNDKSGPIALWAFWALCVLGATIFWLVVFSSAASAQTCEGVTGNGRCNSANSISAIMPITNTDGTAFNDYATSEVVFGLSAGVCAVTTSTIKSLGALGVPVTPLPNTRASALLGPIGLPNGKVFMAWRVVDTTGNRSGCSTEISFTFDNMAPAAPTGLQVGP